LGIKGANLLNVFYTSIYVASNVVKLAAFIYLCTYYWESLHILLICCTLVVLSFLVMSLFYLKALLQVPSERLELLQDPEFLAQALAAQDLADLEFGNQASTSDDDSDVGQRRADAAMHVATRVAMEMAPQPPPPEPELGPNGRPMVKGLAAVRKEHRRKLEMKFAKMDARHERAQEAKKAKNKAGANRSNSARENGASNP